MAEHTKIEWCDATFNAWEGCTKVSPGCKNCYAETRAERYGTVGWGKAGPWKTMSESYWKQPHKWNRDAAKAGRRPRVFCASLADVFIEDHDVPPAFLPEIMAARKRLGQLILDTPNLDWLLLTKRPANILLVARDMWCRFDDSYPLPPNVWVGASVENQAAAAKRIPQLLKVPAKVRFLSCEPLLGAVDLTRWMPPQQEGQDFFAAMDALCGHITGKSTPVPTQYSSPINWIIVGGESGPGARPMHPLWATSLRDQCRAAGVPFFFKQWGSWKPHRYMTEAEWSDLYEREPTERNPESTAKCFVHTVSIPEHPMPRGGPCDLLYALGKKVAGRLLDGREWSEFPEI
jgi:protein gp37